MGNGISNHHLEDATHAFMSKEKFHPNSILQFSMSTEFKERVDIVSRE